MTAVDLDTSVLEDLDFDVAPPCESRGHDNHNLTGRDKSGKLFVFATHTGGPAEWRVTNTCPACGSTQTKNICDNARRLILRMMDTGIVLCTFGCQASRPCREWNHVFTPLSEVKK
jgi:hypothetical protein